MYGQIARQRDAGVGEMTVELPPLSDSLKPPFQLLWDIPLGVIVQVLIELCDAN